MQEFIKRTAQWTEVFVRPANSEKTKFESYRGVRGLQGWIYKRIWYPRGECKKEEWVYQADGISNHDSFVQAYRDLATMKAIYFGTNLEKIQDEQEEFANKLIEEYEIKALAKLP